MINANLHNKIKIHNNNHPITSKISLIINSINLIGFSRIKIYYNKINSNNVLKTSHRNLNKIFNNKLYSIKPKIKIKT